MINTINGTLPVGNFNLDELPAGNTLGLKINVLRELTNALLEQVQSLNAPHQLKISNGINLHEEVRRFEIEMIESALFYTGGHQRAAAQLLGLKPTTLNAKIKLYKISYKPGNHTFAKEATNTLTDQF